ncbi:Uncharacterized protein OBRU01_24190, partial [Operophtera brumata]
MSSNIEALVQSLENLKKLDYSSPSLAFSSHANVEKFLNLIFDIGRKKTNFTEKQKQTLGPLMLHAIKPIQIHVERVGCEYRTRLEPSVYTKRSAIELLIKDYGDWPAGQGRKLSEELASSNIQETISILDVTLMFLIMNNPVQLNKRMHQMHPQALAAVPVVSQHIIIRITTTYHKGKLKLSLLLQTVILQEMLEENGALRIVYQKYIALRSKIFTVVIERRAEEWTMSSYYLEDEAIVSKANDEWLNGEKLINETHWGAFSKIFEKETLDQIVIQKRKIFKGISEAQKKELKKFIVDIRKDDFLYLEG